MPRLWPSPVPPHRSYGSFRARTSYDHYHRAPAAATHPSGRTCALHHPRQDQDVLHPAGLRRHPPRLLFMRALTLAEALRYGHGVERAFLCPEHGDSRPSASVNIIKKRWYCYTCHAHGALGGDALLAEPDYQMMKLWLDNKMA